MPFTELLQIANAIIDSVGPGNLTDEALLKLQVLFPDTLILAALDLIDRGNIIKYSTSWGYCEYEVVGSTATYSVLLNLPLILIPYHCTCPAFTSAVLESETYIMCKHVLAARLAQKMSMCSERSATPDDLAILFQRQFPVSDYH